jgi:hypothetical protein
LADNADSAWTHIKRYDDVAPAGSKAQPVLHESKDSCCSAVEDSP